MIEVQFSEKTRSTVQQWQHSSCGDHWWLCSRPGSGSCWWQEYFTNSSRVKKSVPEWSGDHAPLVAGDHAPLHGQGGDNVRQQLSWPATTLPTAITMEPLYISLYSRAADNILYLLFFLQSLVSFVLYLLNAEAITTKARMQDGLLCCLKKMHKCSSECGVIM